MLKILTEDAKIRKLFNLKTDNQTRCKTWWPVHSWTTWMSPWAACHSNMSKKPNKIS